MSESSGAAYVPDPPSVNSDRAGGYPQSNDGSGQQAEVVSGHNDRVVETCRECYQTRIFTGEFAVEKAQMFLEDGGHYCVDIVELADRDSLLPHFGPADDRDEWSM